MSSTANIAIPPSEASGKDQTGSTRPNPVALEALVTVTGAQPSGSSGSRDLFSEETATVLVFKDGAVIRLTAPVSVGQLLFLTNKKSKEEVVCQVLNKRSFQAAACYVELQFTEDRPNFWGVAFPEGKRGGSEFKVAEQVQAESTTVKEPGTSPAPHDAEAVDHLKKEVEALREKLFSVEKKKAGGGAKPTPPMTPENDVHREIAKGMAEVLAPLMPEAADKNESERAVVDMALPNPITAGERQEEETENTTQESLPDPAVKLSKMAAWVEPRDKRDSNGVGNSKSADRGKSRSVGMSILLIAALAGGAWYGKWWQYLPVGNKPPAAATTNVAKPKVAPIAPATKGKVTTATTATGKSSGEKEAATSAGEKQSKSGASVEQGNGRPGSLSPEQDTEARSAERATSEEEGNPSAKRERAAGRPVSKEKRPMNAAAESVSGEIAASDAPLVPPKLLKAVNPVYPPDAMRKYITGDVKAEVVVKPSGRVGEIKVISGPQALRGAAIEALKQYEFTPATQGGKAVTATATEVVKFWFNP